MNAVTERPVVEIPALGAPFAGGHFMGRVFVGLIAYALVVAPKAEGEHAETPWLESEEEVDVTGANSYFDGLANTNAMVEAGSELAKWARGLRIGEHADWHLPSRQDLLVIKGNEADAGDAFQENGAEAFEREWYWSSSQDASDPATAWGQSFSYGLQFLGWKINGYRARAVRRVPI
jgi:hypothetical protein